MHGVPYTSKYGQLFRPIHSPTKNFKKMPASDIPKPAFASNLKFCDVKRNMYENVLLQIFIQATIQI